MKPILVFLSTFFACSIHAQVNPVLLGSATHAIEANNKSILTQQNRVFACDSLNLVAFIHRQNTTVLGAGEGKFRYDISTNNGQTFNKDIGPLQTAYTYTGQMPQLTGINNSGTSNPLNAKLLWVGNTLNVGTYGIVSGVSNIVNSGTPVSTENYPYAGTALSFQGGLCQGKANEYWMAEQKSDGFNFTDSLYMYKGVYNSITQDIDWSISQRKYVPYDVSFDGTVQSSIPNIAFSPDGMMGWCAFLGDLVGGMDSTRTIVYLKTSDGGLTWSNPQEVNLWQLTNLSSLFLNNPNYTPFMPGFDGDFDITVDNSGNLHFFAHFLPVEEYQPVYEFTPTSTTPIWHSMVDITTANGGSTWNALEIGTAYTFFKEWLGASSLLKMQLQPQIARTEDGKYIFYAWVDSDTTLSDNGVGYGIIQNLAPNLKIEGLDAATQTLFGTKKVTKNDLIWEGMAIFPTMAPTVIRTGNQFQLPIVLTEFTSNMPDNPCNYWYFGKDAYFNDPTMDITESQSINVRLSPNPCKENLEIEVDANEFTITIIGLNGALLQNRTFAYTSIAKINVSSLPTGMYFAEISTKTGKKQWMKWIKE